MDKNIAVIIFFVVMVIIIVAIDVLLFRNHFWARLISNVGIVLIFVALYLRFFK